MTQTIQNETKQQTAGSRVTLTPNLPRNDKMKYDYLFVSARNWLEINQWLIPHTHKIWSSDRCNAVSAQHSRFQTDRQSMACVNRKNDFFRERKKPPNVIVPSIVESVPLTPFIRLYMTKNKRFFFSGLFCFRFSQHMPMHKIAAFLRFQI